MKIRYVTVLLITALVSPLEVKGEQADQNIIAQQLLGQDLRERNNAFEAAREIGPAKAGQELRRASITLLEKENLVVAESRRRGVTLDTLENPEFVAHVASFVAELKD